jgi:tetratricopeptide (TPR) repeat protein
MLLGIKGYDTSAQVAFDPALSALLDRPVNLRAVVEADLARHRALMKRFPQALSAINEVSFDLRRLGRYDEDIAFLTAAIPGLENPGTFDDVNEKVAWFWNALGYGYYMTGKYDAMRAAFTKGIQPNRDGSPNVDVIINFAEYQVAFNRPKDALATLAPINRASDVSASGLLQVYRVHGCAEAALGHLDAARADLAYALAHEKDDPSTVTKLELCVGDEDAAAASYVRRLNDRNPSIRQSAIFALADFDPPDQRAPRSPSADREDRVRKRSDVVAALRATAGSLPRIHLQFEP